MRLLILAIAVILVSDALGSIHEKWQHHIHKHNKTFCNETHELESRKKFEKIDRFIELHNQEASVGKKSFFLAHNEFSSEISDNPTTYQGILPVSLLKKHFYVTPHTDYIKSGRPLPDTFDWRNNGFDTKVRHQGGCGSCWAFSSTASIEAQYAIKNGIKITLSPQELVDCSGKEFKSLKGCIGGHLPHAFGYILKYGITDEESYKYTFGIYRNDNITCPANITSMKRYKISGIMHIPSGDVEALKEALVTQGPIAIGVDSSSKEFKHYSEGIWDGSSADKESGYCSTTITHAVLLVGYGKSSQGRYWIIKNEWGSKWGDKGYINILDNGTNICGIASYAWFPNL